MSKKRKSTRRSFLAQVAGSLTTAGALGAVSGCSTAGPGTPGYTGLTDNDGGPNQDARGFGRGRQGYSGITDSDSGYYQDAAGNGRGTQRAQSGLTDNDPSDPAGNGRGNSNNTSRDPDEIFCTDRDSTAANGRQDPAGYGRCRNSGGR